MTPAPPAEDGSLRGLFAATLGALAARRRAIPILLVSVPMVVVQAGWSKDRMAGPLGVLMVAAFVVVAPVAWRVLLPRARGALETLAGAIVYLGLAVVVVGLVGIAAPAALHMRPTFLTDTSTLAIVLALFCVGGWGLGRDIELEAGLARAEARAAAMAREAERAQILALRSHLDPHFLFNTLNAIAEWCRQDGAVAEQAILQLSSMLRTVMDGVRAPAWPLAREIDLASTLFALHLIRDPGLFTLETEVDPDVLGVAVPPMILLPLAENAMKHGPLRGSRGVVRLTVARDGRAVVVRLVNPGPYAGRRDGGTGVSTVETRLSLAYEGDAALSLSGEGGRTVAILRLPVGGPRG